MKYFYYSKVSWLVYCEGSVKRTESIGRQWTRIPRRGLEEGRGKVLRHWQKLAELCGHVTRGPHKRTLLWPALLFFSFPFSSFRSSFIDYHSYRLARPFCRARASIDWVAQSCGRYSIPPIRIADTSVSRYGLVSDTYRRYSYEGLAFTQISKILLISYYNKS